MTDISKEQQEQIEKENAKKERHKAKMRERYKNDPEYRKKRIASVVKIQKERYKNDPEYRKKRSAYISKRHREKYMKDPDYRTNFCEQWLWRYYEKYKNDPKYQERVKNTQKRISNQNRTVDSFKKQLRQEEIQELKRRFLDALEKSAFIGITAKHLDLTESRVYGWMQKDPEFANAVRAAQARMAERVGLALISKALTENDTTAQIFICKTLGRSLGFDEKQPVVNINMGTQPDLDVSNLSFEEKENLLHLLRKSRQGEQEAIDVS
jgi:hypothetical protein